MTADFRTTFKVEESKFKIKYADKLFLAGSCFTDHIGLRLQNHKFQTLINPFGVMFNPISLANSLTIALDKQLYTSSDLNSYNNTYFHFDFHGKFRQEDKGSCLQQINEQVELSHQQLMDCNFLFISFGTAQVYLSNTNNKIVANCHKLPQKYFTKQLLDIEEIRTSYEQLIEKIRAVNPNIKICFTLSPVKHIKDGIVQNKRSKAILLVAIHKLVEKYDFCSYFPSFELLTDDLRDYRFYEEDMIHPNQQAIEYIWERFKQAYIDSSAFSLMDEINKIEKAVNHRPLKSNSAELKSFAKKQLKIIERVENDNKSISLEKEKAHLQQLLYQIDI